MTKSKRENDCMKVKVAETALAGAGIGTRFFSCSLAKIKDNHVKSVCRLFTHKFPNTKKDVGVCVYGEENEERNNVFYGIAKALFAQGNKLKIISVGDITSAYFNDKEQFALYSSVPVLGVTELGVAEDVLNKGSKTAVYDLFRKRVNASKVLLVATSLEVEHPEQCVDMTFPGLGNLLIANTLLINISGEKSCSWLQKEHAVTKEYLKSI